MSCDVNVKSFLTCFCLKNSKYKVYGQQVPKVSHCCMKVPQAMLDQST